MSIKPRTGSIEPYPSGQLSRLNRSKPQCDIRALHKQYNSQQQSKNVLIVYVKKRKEIMSKRHYLRSAFTYNYVGNGQESLGNQVQTLERSCTKDSGTLRCCLRHDWRSHGRSCSRFPQHVSKPIALLCVLYRVSPTTQLGKLWRQYLINQCEQYDMDSIIDVYTIYKEYCNYIIPSSLVCISSWNKQCPYECPLCCLQSIGLPYSLIVLYVYSFESCIFVA